MKNQGYEILDSIKTSVAKDGREFGFAIGHNPLAPSPWVTWRYIKPSEDSSTITYCSGNYWADEQHAKRDYYRRISETYSD